MCGRASLSKTEKELEERFDAGFYSEDLLRYKPLPNYNVAPSHFMPVILNQDKSHFSPVRWGFIPFWAKDKNIGYKMINARIESALEKNSFKKSFENKRCLVPADGFYEWKKTGKSKQPFRILLRDESIFIFAGLWSKWTSPEDGTEVLSFTIMTQEPNALVKEIHDRMPVILRKDHEEAWLDKDVSPAELIKLLEPYPEDEMKAYPVSDRVNKVSNNDAELIQPNNSEQGSLF
jgi:putative SOS response-associated peptidase YedK